MKIEVKTFKKGTLEESARKVCEEATEMYGAYSVVVGFTDFDGMESTLHQTLRNVDLMAEIGDVLTAAANLCERLGIEAQDCVELAQTKNLIRGYYGNPREVALEWERDTHEDSSSEQCDDSL